MRRFSILALLVFATPAMAKVKIHVVTIQERCSLAPSWDKLTTCLQGFGTPRVIASINSARVIEVMRKSDDDDRHIGTYLYVNVGKQWRLGGMYTGDGELLRSEAITIAGHAGYRLDVAESSLDETVLADNTSAPALMSRRISVYCSGESSHCTEAVTACDIIVHGKAYRTFRGTVRIAKAELEIVGDRTYAGDCAPAEKTSFRWHAED